MTDDQGAIRAVIGGAADLPAETPDGYHICPECGHHTSSAQGGHCTVIIPTADGEDEKAAGYAFRYCNCDCYLALHGETLQDVIARSLRGEPA